MATVVNLNQYLTQGAIEGFLDLIAPITAFSYVVKPGAVALNDNVRVPFAQNTSASNAFAYSTGYATEGNAIVGKTVTLNNLLYQMIKLSDSDLMLLNPESLVRIGHQAGARLAIDVISSSFAATLTTATYTNSGSAPGYLAASLSSSAGLAALDKAANDAKFPDGERTLICNTTAWAALMSNAQVVNFQNFGSTDPVQQGKLRSVLGFTPYKTTLTIPGSKNGFIVNPNALLFGNGYHTPQDYGAQYNSVQQMTDAKSGLTIGFRQYYDPVKATNVRVFDCLFGSAVGDSTALIWVS